jgi:ParB family chromosome partitioning protein
MTEAKKPPRRRRDLAAAVDAAGDAGNSLAGEDKFDRATDLLVRRPTGYSTASPVTQESFGTPVSPDGARSSVHLVIPVSEIDENPFNARRIYRQERIEKLAVSIAGQGQIVPGIATVRGGRYTLVAGHYRLRAIKFAGLPTIELMVHHDLTDQQLYKMSFEENDERDDQSVLDNALAWRDLIERKVYADETTLSEAIGKSLPNVNKTLAILKLSDPVMEIVRADPAAFPLSALYELTLFEKAAGTAGVAQSAEMAQQLATGEIGRKEIQEMRQRVETPHQRKKKETSRQYRIMVGGQPVGAIKDFDDGRVKLEVKVDDPKEREELVTYLKHKFQLS